MSSAAVPAFKQSHVAIQDHPSNPYKLVVDNNEFWVSKSKGEVVEWFCTRRHQHGQKFPCFTVRFDKQFGSPFKSAEFISNDSGYACSDDIVAPPGTTIYEYTVRAHDKEDLDPGGGVKG
jgi:hypothetical protein